MFVRLWGRARKFSISWSLPREFSWVTRRGKIVYTPHFVEEFSNLSRQERKTWKVVLKKFGSVGVCFRLKDHGLFTRTAERVKIGDDYIICRVTFFRDYRRLSWTVDPKTDTITLHSFFYKEKEVNKLKQINSA